MGLTLEDYVQSIKEKRIAIIGIGVSNMPLIELLLKNNCKITVCDKHSEAELGAEAERLRALGAELKLGADHLEGLDQDIIFRSPSLMPFEKHLAEAKEKGSVITTEVEVFMSLCPCRIIAVTGSDGKTTTSTIISELLREEGYTVHLGGNIGHPLLCETPEIKCDDIAVLELSSFQLHSMTCKPDVAVITNISPNHLDKHLDFQDYIDAKKEIFANQDASGKLILKYDDPYSEYYASSAKGEVSYFSDKAEILNGTELSGGMIYRVKDGVRTALIPAEVIRLPGAHNLLNYLAAFAAVDGMVSNEVCDRVARNFAGVEHRLEHVREFNGVLYINDSIGTSPTRKAAGLHALKTKPIVIAGGYDKLVPFDSLGDDLCLYAKRVFLTGDTAEKIRAAIVNSRYYGDSGLEISMIDDFRAAVLAAASSAEEGDIVLLSPACAAFDRFKNFAERGKYFKEIVMGLDNEDFGHKN